MSKRMPKLTDDGRAGSARCLTDEMLEVLMSEIPDDPPYTDDDAPAKKKR